MEQMRQGLYVMMSYLLRRWGILDDVLDTKVMDQNFDHS